MGRRKARNIRIREDRLSELDTTKFEVAIWLLAKGKVEDRTQRSQPAPPTKEGVNLPPAKRDEPDKTAGDVEAA
jgi:hypothetical protein